MSSQGRQVHRSLYVEYLDRVRACHETAAHEKAMGKRKVWVEPLFGEAKDWHGLRRLHTTGRDGKPTYMAWHDAPKLP